MSSNPAVSEAPRADSYYCEIPNDPCAIVMFGASGDLAKRKLLPALYDLALHSCLAPRFRLLGFARTELSDDAFRTTAGEFLSKVEQGGANDGKRKEFLEHLHYFPGNYDDPESYKKLAQRLEALDGEGQLGGNRLFYLATPPEVYEHVIEQLGRAGLAKSKNGESWTRIIIEKPFGRDGASARDLNAKVLRVFEEQQVYRIDHYLGKETVQNLLVLRFGNGIFEPLWNRTAIDHVQITVAEDIGIGHRAGYYDRAGALRDVIQNHALQLLSLVAMEPPASFDADLVRDEKAKALRAAHPLDLGMVAKSVVRGQYGQGQLGGKQVPGYREEPGVDANSRTETF